MLAHYEKIERAGKSWIKSSTNFPYANSSDQLVLAKKNGFERGMNLVTLGYELTMPTISPVKVSLGSEEVIKDFYFALSFIVPL